MRWTAAAIGQQNEIPWIMSLLDCHLADKICHLIVDDLKDAMRRLFSRQSKRSPDPLFYRSNRIIPAGPAMGKGEGRCVNKSKDDIRIGYRGIKPPQPITGGTGI